MIATEAQRKKFNAFMTRPDVQSVIECAVQTVFAAGLDLDGMGVRWGITACVDKNSVLRLNVGQRVLLDVTSHGIELFAVHPRGEPAAWRYGGMLYGGFPEVKDSVRLIARDPHDVIDLLANHPELASKVRSHAEASSRPLPRSDWHNLLLDDLIVRTATAVRQGHRHLARQKAAASTEPSFDVGLIDLIAQSRDRTLSADEISEVVNRYLQQRPVPFGPYLDRTHARLFALVAAWVNAPAPLLDDRDRLCLWLGDAVRLADLAERVLDDHASLLMTGSPSLGTGHGSAITIGTGADDETLVERSRNVVNGAAAAAEGTPAQVEHDADRADVLTLISRLEEVIALDPDYAGHRSRIGDLLLDIGDHEGAVNAYRAAVQRDPENGRLHADLAVALSLTPDQPVAEIVEHYRRAMQREPQNTALLLGYAEWLSEIASCFDPKITDELSECGFQDIWNDIRGLLARATELEPGNAACHYQLGETFVLEDLVLLGEGDPEAALPHYTKAVELDPEDGGYHCALAELLRDLDDLEGAEAHYLRTLAVSPDHMNALHGLATVLSLADRHDEALPLHRRAVSLCPNCTHFQIGLADCLGALGLIDEAVVSYLAAVAELQRLGEQAFLEEAVDVCTELLRLEARHVAAHSRLAVVLDELGSIGDATVHHRRVIDLTPEFTSVWNRFVTRLEAMDASELMSTFQGSLQADPDNRDLYLLVARLLSSDGLSALSSLTND